MTWGEFVPDLFGFRKRAARCVPHVGGAGGNGKVAGGERGIWFRAGGAENAEGLGRIAGVGLVGGKVGPIWNGTIYTAGTACVTSQTCSGRKAKFGGLYRL